MHMNGIQLSLTYATEVGNEFQFQAKKIPLSKSLKLLPLNLLSLCHFLPPLQVVQGVFSRSSAIRGELQLESNEFSDAYMEFSHAHIELSDAHIEFFLYAVIEFSDAHIEFSDARI